MGAQGAQGAVLALGVFLVILAPIVTAAPTLSDTTDLDVYDGAGCYYNFQHYGEGDRIMTNEPCLNCTCHNRMLMCYLRVCPFTKPIGQDCKVENRGDQCCPIITCPDVPVDLMSATTSSPSVYSTEVGHHDNYGCSIDNKFYSEGARVPSKPNKPCELCYCIRNMTACVMQECTLHVEGCTPVYQKEVCCPVRYSCDHPEGEEPLMLDYLTTTERPTPGFMLTTTLPPGYTSECYYRNETYADGACITTDKACEHCYCMKGDMVCAVQECGTPMENEGKNCTALPAREGQCCPDTYICDGDQETITTVDDLLDDQKPLRDHLTTPSEDFIEKASDVPILDAEKHDEEESTTAGQHDLATQTRAEKGESEEENVEATTKFAHPDDKYHSTEKHTTDHYITEAPVVPGEEESTEPKDKDQKHDAVDDLQQTTLGEDEIISVTESHDDRRPELEMDDHKKPDEKETTVHDKYDEVTEHKVSESSTEHEVKLDEATEAKGQEVTEHVKHDAVTEHDGQEEVTDQVKYDESTEHVKHDEVTEHEKHDEATEHVKHDETTEHAKHGETTEYVKHDEATEHVKHDEATEHVKHDETTEHAKHGETTEHVKHDETTEHAKHGETTEYVKHDETSEHIKHDDTTDTDKHDEATEHVKYDGVTEHEEQEQVTDHVKYDEATEHVKHDETTGHVKHDETTEQEKYDEATEHVKHDETTEHEKYDEATEHVKHDETTEHEKHDEATEHVKHDEATEHVKHDEATEHVKHDETTEHIKHDDTTDTDKHDEATEHVKYDGVTEHEEQEQVTDHVKYDEATEHVKHDETTEHVKHDEVTEPDKHDEATEHVKHDETTEHVKHDEVTTHDKHGEDTEYVEHDETTEHVKYDEVTEHDKHDEATEHVKYDVVTEHDEQKQVTDHDKHDDSTEHVDHDESTEHEKHDEVTEHVKHDGVTEYDEQEQVTEHEKHDEATEHVKHDEVTEHVKHDEATEHEKHDESTEHMKHDEVTELEKHDEATEHVKHDGVTDVDKQVTEQEKYDEVTEHVKHEDVTKPDEQEVTEHLKPEDETPQSTEKYPGDIVSHEDEHVVSTKSPLEASTTSHAFDEEVEGSGGVDDEIYGQKPIDEVVPHEKSTVKSDVSDHTQQPDKLFTGIHDVDHKTHETIDDTQQTMKPLVDDEEKEEDAHATKAYTASTEKPGSDILSHTDDRFEHGEGDQGSGDAQHPDDFDSIFTTTSEFLTIPPLDIDDTKQDGEQGFTDDGLIYHEPHVTSIAPESEKEHVSDDEGKLTTPVPHISEISSEKVPVTKASDEAPEEGEPDVHVDKDKTSDVPETTDRAHTSPKKEDSTEVPEPAVDSYTTHAGESLPHAITTQSSEKSDEATDKEVSEKTTEKSSDFTTAFGTETDQHVSTDAYDHDFTEQKPIDIVPQPPRIPGEGNCFIDGVSYGDGAHIPPISKCQATCQCVNSVIKCEHIPCSPPPPDMKNCQPILHAQETCCPSYICEQDGAPVIISDSHTYETTAVPSHDVTEQGDAHTVPEQDEISSEKDDSLLSHTARPEIDHTGYEYIKPGHKTPEIVEEPIEPSVYVPDCGTSGCSIDRTKSTAEPAREDHTSPSTDDEKYQPTTIKSIPDSVTGQKEHDKDGEYTTEGGAAKVSKKDEESEKPFIHDDAEDHTKIISDDGVTESVLDVDSTTSKKIHEGVTDVSHVSEESTDKQHAIGSDDEMKTEAPKHSYDEQEVDEPSDYTTVSYDDDLGEPHGTDEHTLDEDEDKQHGTTKHPIHDISEGMGEEIEGTTESHVDHIPTDVKHKDVSEKPAGDEDHITEKVPSSDDEKHIGEETPSVDDTTDKLPSLGEEEDMITQSPEFDEKEHDTEKSSSEIDDKEHETEKSPSEIDDKDHVTVKSPYDVHDEEQITEKTHIDDDKHRVTESDQSQPEQETERSPTHIDGQEHLTEKLPSEDIGVTTSRIPGKDEDELKTTISDLSESHTKDISDLGTTAIPVVEKTTVSSDDVNKIGVSVLPTDVVEEDCGSSECEPKKSEEKTTESGIIAVPVGDCGELGCQVEVEYTRVPVDKHSTEKPTGIETDCESGDCKVLPIEVQTHKTPDCGDAGCAADDQENIIGTDSDCDGHECQPQAHDTTKKPTYDTSHTPTQVDCGEAGCGPEHGVDISKIPERPCEGSNCGTGVSGQHPGKETTSVRTPEGSENEITDELCGPAGCGPEESHTKKPLVSDCNESGCKDEAHKPSQEDKPVHKDGTADCDSAECKYQPKPSEDSEAPEYTTEHKIPHGDDEDLQTNEVDDELKTKPVDVDQHPIEGSTESVTDDKCTDGVCGEASTDKTPIVTPEDGQVTDEHACIGDTCSIQPEISTDKPVEDDSTDISQKPVDEPECTAEKCEPSEIKPHKPVEVLPETEIPDETSSEKEEHLTKAPEDQDSVVTDVASDIEKTTLSSTHVDKVPDHDEHEHIDHSEQPIDTEKGTTSTYDVNAPDIKTEVPAIHDHTKTPSEIESGEYPDHTLKVQTLSPDDEFEKQTTATPSDIYKDTTEGEGVSKPHDETKEDITTQKSVTDSTHVTKKVDESDEDETGYQKPIDHTVPESGYDDVTTVKADIDSGVDKEHATGKPDVDGEEEKEKVPHVTEKQDGTSIIKDTEDQHTTEYSDTRTKGTSEKAPSEDGSQFTVRPVVVEISTDKQQELDTKAPGISDEQTTESASSKPGTKDEKPEDNLDTVTKQEDESQQTEKPDYERKTETPDITHIDHITGKPDDQDEKTGKPEYDTAEHSTQHYETTQHDEEEGKPETEHSTHTAGEYDIDKHTEKPEGEEPVESATEKPSESKKPSSSTDESGDEHVTQVSEKDRPEVDEEVTEVSEADKPHREPTDHSTEKYDDGTEKPKSPEHVDEETGVDDGKEHDRETTERYDEQKLEKSTEGPEAGKITPIIKDHETPEEGTEKPAYDTKTEKTEPHVTEQDTSKYETSSPETGHDDHTQRLPEKADDDDKVTEYPEIKYTDITEVYEMPEQETRRPALESDAHVMEVEKETKKPSVHVEVPTKEDVKPEHELETGKPHHEIITDRPHDEKHEISEQEKKTEKPDSEPLEHITTKYEQPDVESTEKVVGESLKPEHDGETERPHIASTQQDSETSEPEEETTKESEIYDKDTKVPSDADEQKTEAPEYKPSKDTHEMEPEKESTEKTLIDVTSSYEKETKRPESTLPVQETEDGGKVTEIPEHDKEIVVDEEGTLRPSVQDKDEEHATGKPSKPIEQIEPLDEQETLRPDIGDEEQVTNEPSKPVDHESTEHGKPLHEDETRRPDIGGEEQVTGKPYDHVPTEDGKPVDEQQTLRPVVGDDEEITDERKPLDEQDTLRPVVGEEDITGKPSLPDHSATEDETKRPGDKEPVTVEPFEPVDHVPTEHGKRPDIGDEEITDEPTKSVEDATAEHEKPSDEQHTHRPISEEDKTTDIPYKPIDHIPDEHEKPLHEGEIKRPVIGDEEEVTNEPSEPIDHVPTEHGKPSDEKETRRPVVGDEEVTEEPSTPSDHVSIDEEKHTRRPISGEDEESTDKPYKPVDHIPTDHKKPSDEQETLRPDIGEDEESTDKPYKPVDHIPTDHKKPSDEQETLRPDIGEDGESTDKPYKPVDHIPTEHGKPSDEQETPRPDIGEDEKSTDKPYKPVDHIPTEHGKPSGEQETLRPQIGEDDESTDKPYKPADHIPTDHITPSDEQETLRPDIGEDEESTDKPYKPVDHIPAKDGKPSDEQETIRPQIDEDDESTDKPYKPIDHIPTDHGKPSDEQETLRPHIGEDEESTDKPYKPIDHIPTEHEKPSKEQETLRPDIGDEEQITTKHPQSDYDEKTEIPYHVKTEKPFVDEGIDYTTDSEIKETGAPTLELTTVGTPSGDVKTEKTTSEHPDDHTLKSDEERTTEKSEDVTGEHVPSDEQGTEPPGHKPEEKPEHDHNTEKPQHGLETVVPEDGQATEKATLYPHDYDKDHTKEPISDEDDEIKSQHTTESDITHTEKEKVTPHGGLFDEITTIRPLEDADAEKHSDEKEHVTKHPSELESSEKTDKPSDDTTTEHVAADHETKEPEVPSEDVDKETDEVSHTTSRPLPETAHYTKPSASSTQSPFDEGYTSKYPMVHHTKPPSQVHDKYPDEGVPQLPVPHHDHQVPDFHAPYGGNEQDYEDEDQSFGPGTCRYGGKVYVSAQQIPRDDPCDFCFCFRSDIICLQQSCPPPIQHCHEEPISGFCCPRYECPVSMATVMNVTTTTTTTTTTLPPHFLSHAYKGAAQRRGCQIKGQAYKVGEFVRSASGPCLHCTCGGDGQMKCDPKVCTPEPMLRQMIAVAATSRRR
ncbi:tenectin [Arctopsyche grandis]|uniref:tenectin n=1 Tax=Arctopsyche grandis TaxID=121162 RepID=UPI00406D7B7B